MGADAEIKSLFALVETVPWVMPSLSLSNPLIQGINPNIPIEPVSVVGSAYMRSAPHDI